MAPPLKKRRVADSNVNGHAPDQVPKDSPADALAAASADEKRTWQGFCEIESEPAFFNVMLKDFGVKGVKVQEVFGLEEELLALLPKPVFGLIFLFRYKSDDLNNQEATCPDNVWFANQTADFSCATVSLLNIVNNIRGIELGQNLAAFKEYTKDFTPALRGDAIENFAFVKEIHNSFARKMDMLNIDLGLQNAYDDRRKSKVSAAPKDTSKKSSKSKKGTVTPDDYTDHEAAFHFSAYVPIDGEVWKLDGLDRQPQRIGKLFFNRHLLEVGTWSTNIFAGQFSDNDWLSVITPVIQDRMTAYSEGQIEFGLLSLVKDPLDTLLADLAQNMKSINLIQQHLTETLDATGMDSSPENEDGPLDTYGDDVVLGITSDMIDQASVSPGIETALEDPAMHDLAYLRATRKDLISDHARLRREALDEIFATRNDEKKAWDRRQDYGPAIYAWVRMLAQKDGLLKELIEYMRVRDGGDVLD